MYIENGVLLILKSKKKKELSNLLDLSIVMKWTLKELSNLQETSIS